MKVSDVEFKPGMGTLETTVEPPDSPLTPSSIKIEPESDEDYLPGKSEKKKPIKLKIKKQKIEKAKKRKKSKSSKKKKQEHKLWTCRKCLQEFDSRKGLTEHAKLHHEESSDEHTFKHDEELDMYYCNTCSAEYHTKAEVEEHITKVHEEFYSCDQCEHTSKKAYAFAIHMKSHSNDEYMVCPLCTYTTPRRTCLQTHINRVHYHKFYYTCGTCGKGFNDSVIFKEHNNEHLGIKPFVCVVCEKAFCYSRYMTIHQTRHHTVYIEGSLHKTQCSICLKVFSKVTTLLKHITSKHSQGEDRNEKRHLCDHCGKGFGTGDKLKIHYRIHTGEKPYHCRFCDKCFTKKDYLVMHERVHTGEKPYPCEYCGKCFNQACSLRIHVRGHTGERPYICSICNGGYISRGSLNLHMKTCSGERYDIMQKTTKRKTRSKNVPKKHDGIIGITFQCYDCQQKFKSLQLLTQHMKFQCQIVAKAPRKKSSQKNDDARELLSKLPGIRIVEKTKPGIGIVKKTSPGIRIVEKTKKAPLNKSKPQNSSPKCFFACPECPQIFSSKEFLDKHQITCGTIKEPSQKKLAATSFEPYTFDRFSNVYTCTKCFMQFDFKSTINEHVKSAHTYFHCDVCDIEFDSPLDYGYHSVEHAPDMAMSCPCCPFRTALKPKLAYHFQTDHSDADINLPNADEVNFICVVCGKSFFNLRKLVHHQKNVHKANIICEPILGAKLLDSKDMTPREPISLLCDTCGKNFSSKYRLERHQRAMHQGLKPFICDYCGRAFTGKDTLKKHERIHTGEKPYHCEFCGKNFRQPGPFSVHRRIHTGERPYKCKFCNRGFITNQIKKMHMKNCTVRSSKFNPDNNCAIEIYHEVEEKVSPLLGGTIEISESEEPEVMGAFLPEEYFYEYKS